MRAFDSGADLSADASPPIRDVAGFRAPVAPVAPAAGEGSLARAALASPCAARAPWTSDAATRSPAVCSSLAERPSRTAASTATALLARAADARSLVETSDVSLDPSADATCALDAGRNER